MKIKFGTDGWRAIIAREYTVEGVLRVSIAAAKWMQQNQHDKVVIGYDCRFGGKMFATAAATAFIAQGIKVLLDPNFVSTPMVSLGVVKFKAGLGIVITASHNPPDYNGYKLKASYGGPSIPAEVAAVEELIPDASNMSMQTLADLEGTGQLEYVNLEEMYIDHIRSNFDMDSLTKVQDKMAYDAMYGAGQNVIKRLFPQATHLHCDYNPSFKGTAPEPIDRNLRELSDLIAAHDHLTFGLANDGDADRIGMYDEDGVFVDAQRLLLLLLKYLYEYKGITSGKVVCSFSVTDRMKRLADKYNLTYQTTQIGFKHIAEYMSREPVLIGGEESGGIAVSGHIPERDGIWTGLLLMEYMGKSGKSLKELIQDVFADVGEFDFYRDDLHLSNAQKIAAIEKCKSGIKQFGAFQVISEDNLDGFKYTLEGDCWVMVRPSGTEPVLRVYAQAVNMDKVRDILDAAKATLVS